MLAQAEDGGKGLKRTLGAGNLVALGVGAIIGAGLFVRTAAAAGQGPDTRPRPGADACAGRAAGPLVHRRLLG